MSDQIISDGTYTLMGPGGQLTMPTQRMGPGSIILLPPNGSDKTQQWAVKSTSDSYTLKNVATGSYLGNDDYSDGPVMILNGTKNPVNWLLMDGPDDDPDSYILASADSRGLVLAPSLLRIYPPQLAILPQYTYPFEWTFAKVG